ncbi:Oxyanion-translocating ATPase [Alteromonadaceae bacterium Bs31]|nr:Oxyanion-translocating ATPase [Alteromonadaceae bacterium Bs31]
MSRVHFIGGEKGGVGKSFTARLLAQYYVDSGLSFQGFDADMSHQTFSRFYGDFNKPLQVGDYESLDQIIDAAAAKPEVDIIVDLAAQTSAQFEAWVDDSATFDLLKMMGFESFLWHVMDDGFDSVCLLDKLILRRKKDPANLVVVENFGRGDSFELFEKSETYARADKFGATFFHLSHLHPALARKVDFNCSSFWAASNNQDGLSIAERQRVRIWLIKQYAQIEALFDSVESKAASELEQPGNIIAAKF